MGCRKNNYSRIDIDDDYDNVNIKDMRKAGNKSIRGLMNKRVVVKRRGCKR